MRRFGGHWWEATIHGVAGGWFGWAIAATALILAFVQQQFGLIKNIDQTHWWFSPIASAFGALLLALLANALLFAPYRAWRMLRPFMVKVISGTLESEYPAEKFVRQHLAIAIKNKSYLQRSCVLHIYNISEFDNRNHSLPRCVKEFSVQRGEIRQIEFLSWTTRSKPYENDKIFVLSGPIGGGLGGNFVALPCGSYDIELRLGVADGDPTRILCRVWIDGDELKVAN